MRWMYASKSLEMMVVFPRPYHPLVFVQLIQVFSPEYPTFDSEGKETCN
jgi:hypothetical protein